MQQIHHYDIAIIGAGAVGMACAIALAQRQYRVLLLDQQSRPDRQGMMDRLSVRDARVYAMNLPSIELLTQIGVWQKVVRKADYTQMQVWAKDGKGELLFAEDDLLPKTLGSMIEPSVLNMALWERAVEPEVAQYLTLAYEAKLAAQGIDVGKEVSFSYHVLGETHRVACRLLIGADGRQSQVRQMMGIQVNRLDYHQKAVCCAIKTTRPHQHTARQIMLPTGTLAMLPIADLTQADKAHWHSIVWTLPTVMADEYLALSEVQLMQQLAIAMNDELGEISQIESIASFALSAQMAQAYAVNQTVLIGDAAHGVHPLAGQGLNLGFFDVLALLDELDKVAKRGVPLHQQALNAYQRACMAHHGVMMHSFSMINFAFTAQFAQSGLLPWVRSKMMDWLSKQKSIVRFLNHKANAR